MIQFLNDINSDKLGTLPAGSGDATGYVGKIVISQCFQSSMNKFV